MKRPAETSDATPINGIRIAHEELNARYASSGFVRPEIPPRDFENPDASIQLNGKFVSALIASSIPPLIEFSGGVIDTRNTKEKRINLYTPKSTSCPYSQGHTVQIGLLSIADRTKRTIVTLGGDVWTLDTIDAWSAPSIRSADGKLFIDVAVQIGYVQDIDWSGGVLVIVNGIIQNKVNPKLPNPLFSIPVDQPTLPQGATIAKAALRIDGCWYQDPSVVVDLKFA
jgi:hypothetical protein